MGLTCAMRRLMLLIERPQIPRLLLGAAHSDVSETPLQKNLGHVIRAERLALSLSQEELGERCQLHRTYIGIVERGESNITLQNLERIANALNTRVWTLLRAAEETNANP